jgi:hypothetical protein
MLRRLAGSRVRPENFIEAAIDSKNVGPAQPPPVSPDLEWPQVFTMLAPATTYYWQVATLGRAGTVAHMSPVWRFTTRGGPPTNVVIAPTAVWWMSFAAPWVAAADATASNQNVLLSPRAFRTADRGWSSTEVPPLSSLHRFDIKFWAEPGVPYHLWLRLKAENDSKWNDSVWVQFVGALVNGRQRTGRGRPMRSSSISRTVLPVASRAGAGRIRRGGAVSRQ